VKPVGTYITTFVFKLVHLEPMPLTDTVKHVA